MSSSQCLKIAQKCLTWQSDFTTSCSPYLQANRNEVLPLLSLTIKSIFVNKLCSLRSQCRKIRLFMIFSTTVICSSKLLQDRGAEAPDDGVRNQSLCEMSVCEM